jgi:hypothetical protein
MKIELKFTDAQARRIRYFFEKKYKAKKTAKLESLCRMAILQEVSKIAAAEDVKEAELKTPHFTGSACMSPFSACRGCGEELSCPRNARHLAFLADFETGPGGR